MFHKFENRYVFSGIIRTTTALHIGGGAAAFTPRAIDNSVLKDKNNLPFIPGSSLKGVLRSYLERVLLAKNEKVCMIPNLCSDKFKNKSDRDKKWKEERERNSLSENMREEILSKAMYEELCPVCRLFGSNISGAKLMVRDSRVIEESFMGFEYRNGVAIDRDKNIAKDGALYDIEVVPADTLFQFKVVLENASGDELRNTVFLIKTMENGDLQIGGMTSRGLGEFVLEDINIEYMSGENLFDVITGKVNSNITLEELQNKVFGGGI